VLLHVHQLSGCKEDASPEAIARTLRLEGYDDPTHLQKLQPRLHFRLLLLVQKRPSDSEMLCACAQRQLGLTSGGLIGVLHSTAIAAQARSSSSSSNSSDNLAAAAGDASSSMAEEEEQQEQQQEEQARRSSPRPFLRQLPRQRAPPRRSPLPGSGSSTRSR
jgi:hypothetical protein